MNYLFFVFVLLACFSVENLSAQAGTPDSTFADQGIYDEVSQAGSIVSIMPKQNGEIICFTREDPTGFSVVNFTSNGIFYFDRGIYIPQYQDPPWGVEDVIEIPGGNYLGAGTYNHMGSIFKFLPIGSVDTSFGDDGHIDFTFTSELEEIVVQKNDNILGLITDNNFTLFRLQPPNYQLDSTFGTNGLMPINLPSGSSPSYKITTQRNGKILYGASLGKKAMIYRYTPNGAIDNNFGTSGVSEIEIPAQVTNARVIILEQKAGKILALTKYQDTTILFRLNDDASLDSTFGINGFVSLYDSSKYVVQSSDMQVQADGKILVLGKFIQPNRPDNWLGVQRLNANGKKDSTFGDNSVAEVVFYNEITPKDIILLPDGKILLSAESNLGSPIFWEYLVMVRFLSGLNLGILDFTEDISAPYIYPNPIQSSSTLSFFLQHPETLSIDLFNLQGQKVKSFVNQKYFTPGEHKVDLSFDDISTTGYYLLRINNGKQLVGIRVLKR